MSTRRWARVAAAVSFIGALAACSAGPVNEPEAVPSRYLEPPTISASAQARFGKEPVERAYREVAHYAMEQWIDERLIDPKRTERPSAQELSRGVTGHMVPSTAAHWEQTVAHALAGDADAVAEVRLMRFYGLDAPSLTLPTGTPATASQSVTDAAIGVGRPRPDGLVPLTIAFHQQARVPLVLVRKPYPAQLAKDVVFEVLPAEQVARVATETPTRTPVSTPVTTSTATATSTSTIDPNAQWLIVTYEGDVEVKFPEAENPEASRPTG